MLEDDVRGMTEDEVVLNTTLNLTMSPHCGTRQVPQRRHQTGYKDPYGEKTGRSAVLGVRRRTLPLTMLGEIK
jgi:hypothetical protein